VSDDYERMLDDLYPYRRTTPTVKRIPATGLPREQVLADIAAMAAREDAQGDEGHVSGSLYSGDHEHYAFLSDVFAQFGHANVLQRDMYPSATKFEGEIVSMALAMLHADEAREITPGADPCGVLTSGGSESLITALYSYREEAREARGVSRPNVVIPVTAHVALDKGAHWMGIEMRKAPLGPDWKVDVAAVAELIDDQTIALVGSAGNYGHGLVDDIPALSDLALAHGIGLHVDGCLGGFLLPWGEKLGYPVPPWDFRVPGVTSISADTHKYGYALKGTSTLLYRTRGLRKRQYFTAPDWPGGLYLSPGLAGSRSGGLIASTWASLVTMGEEGYLRAAEGIFGAAAEMTAGIRERIPELEVIGEPLFLVAFKSDVVDVYLVNDALRERGWRMNTLQLPPALHFCVTRPNTKPGVVEQYLDDLRSAVDFALEHAGQPAASGAVYGLGGSPEGYGTIDQLMSGVLDAMYETAPELPADPA
jgi:glutamate/tyrosine decarboxylase-like PLP-dependent enzyme